MSLFSAFKRLLGQEFNGDDSKKAYKLVLPSDLYQALQRAAEQHDVTVIKLLRQFIKLGLLALKFENNTDENSPALILRENGQDENAWNRSRVRRMLGETFSSSQHSVYKLVLPAILYTTLQDTAKKQETSLVGLLRQFIELGLLALKFENNTDENSPALILRENGHEQLVSLF
jgi:hypothetical protein